jgi:hypothetical protein
MFPSSKEIIMSNEPLRRVAAAKIVFFSLTDWLPIRRQSIATVRLDLEGQRTLFCSLTMGFSFREKHCVAERYY